MRRTLGLLPALLLAAPVHAGALDVDKPFLCAVTEALECGHDGNCERGTAEDIGIPTFLEVELARKVIRERDGERKTQIRSQQRIDGQLILQGIQEGRAWSMSVVESSGGMSLSSHSEGFGFLVFGACTRL